MDDKTVHDALDALAGYRLRWRILRSYRYRAGLFHYVRLEVSTSTERMLEEASQAVEPELQHILHLGGLLAEWDLKIPARSAEQASEWVAARLGPSHE